MARAMGKIWLLNIELKGTLENIFKKAKEVGQLRL